MQTQLQWLQNYKADLIKGTGQYEECLKDMDLDIHKRRSRIRTMVNQLVKEREDKDKGKYYVKPKCDEKFGFRVDHMKYKDVLLHHICLDNSNNGPKFLLRIKDVTNCSIEVEWIVDLGGNNQQKGKEEKEEEDKKKRIVG